MLDATLWHEIVLAVIIGGLTGRLTDYGAVQLLFRPYTKRHFLGLSLQGVLPARQEALARQVANSIADRLLSEETLTGFISSPEMAVKIRENVRTEVDAWVDRDLPSVREILGDLLSSPEALDEELRVVAASFGEYLGSLASSPEFRERTAYFVARFLADRKHTPMDELLAPGILEGVERFLRSRVAALTEDPAQVAEAVDRWLTGLGAPSDWLSEEAREALRKQTIEKAPDWLQDLEEALKRPGMRDWLDRFVLDSIESFIEDLPGHGFFNELVGWFVRTTYKDNKAFYRKKLLDILPSQVARLRESLKDPAARARFEQKTQQAFDEVIGVRLGARYETIPPQMRQDLKGFIAQLAGSDALLTSTEQVLDRFVTWFRSAPLEEFLPQQVRQLDGTSLEDAAREGPIREAVDFGYDLLLEAGLNRQVEVLLTQAAEFVLNRRIGRLRERLGEERLARIHGTIETQLLAAARREAPRLARLIDVRSLVESKIRDASAPAVESMVKSLARKELNSIFTKGLYGGVVISLLLTSVLLTTEHAVDALKPGWGLPAVAGLGACLLVMAARFLRIPEPKPDTLPPPVAPGPSTPESPTPEAVTPPQDPART